MIKRIAMMSVIVGLSLSGVAAAGTAITNDMGKCAAGKGPAVKVIVNGVKSGAGQMRVQSYPATKSAWLAKGRWLNRIETGARPGTMSFCMPVSATGRYGIAVRHDKNGNGSTDISSDGGGFSNNPSINILNLGKPGVEKVSFNVGPGVTTISINMRYM